LKDIIHSICRLLEQGEGIVLATIISNEGSTPRTAGTKMIVRKNGDSIGTVGGGSVEADVLNCANNVFDSKHALVRSFDMTSDRLSGADMICGGRLKIFVEYLDPEPETLNLFKTIRETLQRGRKCILTTALLDLKEIPASPRRFLLPDEGTMNGDFPYPLSWADILKERMNRTKYAMMLPIEDVIFFLEPFCENGVLYIFGAGHVSRHTAIYGDMVGFRTIVLDDRKEFADKEHFPEQAEVQVISGFESCFDGLAIDENSYLVIVTRGHLYDKVVLERALKTQAGYIGMIGSKRKRDSIYKALLKGGFTDDDLKRVYCPIGMDIGAETPEEIAVSIIAETIKIRSLRIIVS